ncbi:transcription elongation factor A N-terminal and central domain-containing protein 2-like isoform X2 [Mercenaria mercenaria]|uniref:transcription elongation factor A N-terminal and central domain-containing protein 2-like isoform X2 n=1 Tax=Mercenaria mercenaria TaxID=6596 RepID=UPI00234F0C26|nr:transcription elongation factor A N-terminal and central domain-containing protein 2-like isoform X2 [Mercenaria mercenaria]
MDDDSYIQSFVNELTNRTTTTTTSKIATIKMDRFIIRNPTSANCNTSSGKSSGSRMKQTTIESLKGVVVVDDILHHKSRLQLSTSSKEEKLNSLNELGKKTPPRHIMMSTKIGRVINKLRNSEDEDIKKAAKKVYVKWKSHFVEHMDRPMIEVKCDLKTEKLRTSGTKLLTEALSVQDIPSLMYCQSFPALR